MSNDFNRKLLHEERIKKGLSMTALAEKLGVSTAMVSKWESGLNKPSEKSIKSMCEFFGVEPSYWEHFYHEPQKPLNSFTPKPPVRDEAREAFEYAVNPREVDKGKVRENIDKLNGKENETKIKAVKMVLADLKEENKELLEELDANKKAAIHIINELEEKMKAKNTEIQGLECELEGLKVENANLKGQIEGMKFIRPLGEPMKPVVNYASGETETKQSVWKRIFG